VVTPAQKTTKTITRTPTKAKKTTKTTTQAKSATKLGTTNRTLGAGAATKGTTAAETPAVVRAGQQAVARAGVGGQAAKAATAKQPAGPDHSTTPTVSHPNLGSGTARPPTPTSPPKAEPTRQVDPHTPAVPEQPTSRPNSSLKTAPPNQPKASGMRTESIAQGSPKTTQGPQVPSQPGPVNPPARPAHQEKSEVPHVPEVGYADAIGGRTALTGDKKVNLGSGTLDRPTSLSDRAETERVAKLREDLAGAIKYEHWEQAALCLNGFSQEDIHEIVAKLPQHQVAAINDGAGCLGPKSNVAIETRPAYLEREIRKAINGSQWGWATQWLNEFNEHDMRQHLSKLDTATLQALQDHAVTTAGGGPQSRAELTTAAVLEERYNAPAPPRNQAGEMLYASLSLGLGKSSPEATEAAKGLANTFYHVENGAYGSRMVSGPSETAVNEAAKRAGISPEMLTKIIKLVEPFAPRSHPLYIDYAGVGTKKDLTSREFADKLAVVSSPGSTFGSLLASYAAVSGGTAADIRTAAELGTALEAFASTAPARGSASAPPAPTQQENRTGAEIAPRADSGKGANEGARTTTNDAPPASGGTGGGAPAASPEAPQITQPARDGVSPSPPSFSTVSGTPPAGSGGPPTGQTPTQAAERRASQRDPVPQPLQGGGGGNRGASARALADKSNIKGSPTGPLGKRKPETDHQGNPDVWARGENLNAHVMNQHVGLTVQSPENVPEYREWLTYAKQVDGLKPQKKPDMLVWGPEGCRVWDSRTLAGETATVKAALLAIQDKIKGGQTVRIAFNLDAAKNDAKSFARELRMSIRADQRGPSAEQVSAGVKEVVVIKGGIMHRAYP
jgi:hypothetical protein